MVRIADIVPDSIASELQLEIGSRIVRINGEVVRDAIDYRFLEVDGTLELEVSAPGCGESVIYEIEKDAGEALGIVTGADPVRQCANKCVFCFIDGNPAGARQSLHLKDDDFRLSFTYGSYVTLTNLGPNGFRRLIEQRLSPLYVSVHATEPAVRMRLLGVPRGGEIVDQLRALTDAGIEVHTQVVLCPEWNDGAHLDRTIEELWALGPRVLSLSVVPVGLTKYNLNRPVRLLTAAEAAASIERVDAARRRALAERGTGWAYAGDEMYYIAGRPIPEAPYYDDWPLTENGVGSVRSLLTSFEDGLRDVPRLDGRRVAIVTGERMAPVFEPLAERLAAHSGAAVEVVGVRNRMFGATVTTAGLLAGADMRDAVAAAGRFDTILIPGESLNDDDVFIDNLPLADLRSALAPADVRAVHDLTSALSHS
jgi:putative radical SAM enzyme (TIGR03279 family)